MSQPTKRQREVLVALHMLGPDFLNSRMHDSLSGHGWIVHAGMRTFSRNAKGGREMRAVYDISLHGKVAIGVIPELEEAEEPNGCITCEQQRHMGGRPHWVYKYGDWQVECEKPWSFGGAMSMSYLDAYLVRKPDGELLKTSDDIPVSFYSPEEAIERMVEMAHEPAAS